MTATQRPAVSADVPAITELMRASVRELFPLVYTAEQTASAERYIAQLDPVLVADGTYFVHEADGEIVACGGWSRRAKLYVGSGDREGDLRIIDPKREAARIRAMFVRKDWTRRGLGRAILEASEQAARAEDFRAVVLMATLPGVPLYRAHGFTEIQRTDILLPDGVRVIGTLMSRRLPRPDAIPFPIAAS